MIFIKLELTGEVWPVRERHSNSNGTSRLSRFFRSWQTSLSRVQADKEGVREATAAGRQLSNSDLMFAGVIMVPGYEMFRSKPKDWKDPWFSGFIPHYKQSVPAAVLGTSKTTKWGISYSTATFDVPVYLKWLLKNFKAMGGKIAHRDVKHIHELFTADTDIIINCSGLGSRFLGGVMDKTVYPIRGQTVVVRAPQVQYTITQTSGSSDGIWK